MELFSEEHSKCLLGKEWLIKIDSEKSIPYLLKFYHSSLDSSCYVLVTDTKDVWTEVLTSKQFARRWRQCNDSDSPIFSETAQEDSWRSHNLDRLAKAHTLGGVIDMSLEIVKSHNADLAMELECEFFKWRWEAYTTGPRTSAELLSKHLLMPLISTTHLAFTSADPVSELSANDLAKSVDKMGRTARRTVDTHVKHAISNPRVATALQRMTAMFNFLPDLPPILIEADKPDLSNQFPGSSGLQEKLLPENSSARRLPINEPPQQSKGLSPDLLSSHPAPNGSGSETESETEEFPIVLVGKGEAVQSSTASTSQARVKETSPSLSRPQSQVQTQDMAQASVSDTESPPRPSKKPKPLPLSSSEEDSEDERRRQMSKIVTGAGAKRGGTRQPIKRGGRRF